MTKLDIETHRAVFAKGVEPANNEIIWWMDIFARQHEKMLGTGDVHVGLSPPSDTGKLWYKPNATNSGNGTYYVYNAGAWQVCTAALFFSYLKTRAGFIMPTGLEFYVQNTAPSTMTNGAMWVDTTNDHFKVLITNHLGAQSWLDISALSGGGGGGLSSQIAYSFLMNNTNASAAPNGVNPTGVTADASPALTRIVWLFDPSSGQPFKTTLSQLKAALGVPSSTGLTISDLVGGGLGGIYVVVGVPLGGKGSVLSGSTINAYIAGQGYSGWFSSGAIFTIIDNTSNLAAGGAGNTTLLIRTG